MDDRQMIKGAWAFVMMMTVAGLGAFVLTAVAASLGLAALHVIHAPELPRWLISSTLLAGTVALVASKQRAR